MSYESPITQIMSDMQYKYEEDCVKVVQSYGFDVDKEELTKALLYDRNQYEKGYQQGKADAIKDTELFREIFLEDLINQSVDREEAIMYRNICEMSWSKYLEQLKEQK